MSLKFPFLRHALIWLMALCLPASAAEITGDLKIEDGGPNAQFILTLKGPIEKGDARRIRALARESGLAPENDWADLVLSLDSPGGNFVEAIEIAKVLNELGIGTYVGRDAVCASACAIAFMGGADINTQFTVRDRSIHPKGKLGFHAPSLGIEGDQAIPASQLNAAFTTALQSMSAIIEAEQFLGMSRSLIARMIGTPPQDMYFLSTIGEAGRWGIAIDANGGDTTPDQNAIAEICTNHANWRAERRIVPAMGSSASSPNRPEWGDFRVDKYKFKRPFASDGTFYLVPQTGDYTIGCYVYWNDRSNTPAGEYDKRVSYIVGTSFATPDTIRRQIEENSGDYGLVPWTASLPANTPLASVRGASTRLTPGWPVQTGVQDGLCRVFTTSAKLVSEVPCSRVLKDGKHSFVPTPELASFIQKWQALSDWDGVQASKLSPEGRFDQASCIFDRRNQDTFCFQQ